MSLSDDRQLRARLAQKIAHYGYTLNPLILDQLGLTRADFAGVERAMTVERDEEKAIGLVDERMLRIGVVGVGDVIERLEPLVAAGATHQLWPAARPQPVEAVRLLGQVVAHFRR